MIENIVKTDQPNHVHCIRWFASYWKDNIQLVVDYEIVGA